MFNLNSIFQFSNKLSPDGPRYSHLTMHHGAQRTHFTSSIWRPISRPCEALIQNNHKKRTSEFWRGKVQLLVICNKLPVHFQDYKIQHCCVPICLCFMATAEDLRNYMSQFYIHLNPEIQLSHFIIQWTLYYI